MKVYLNGDVVAADQARIDPTDRGLTLGDGVFETIAVAGGVPKRLSAHLERLRYGLEFLGFAEAPIDRELTSAVELVIAANGLEGGLLRLTISRGPAARGLIPPKTETPTVLVTAAPAGPPDPPPVRAIIAAATRRNEYSPLARLKTVNYLDNVIAAAEAAERGADDAILLNTAGRLAETTVANVFVVIEGRILTPPVADGALPGVVRADIVAAGEAVEKPLVPADLSRASEVFATNSAGIRPIVEIDGAAVGDGRPGPAWERLRAMV